MDKRILQFSDLKPGMKVKDEYGNLLVIIKCNDIQYIPVKFVENGGYSICCLDPTYQLFYDKLFSAE